MPSAQRNVPVSVPLSLNQLSAARISVAPAAIKLHLVGQGIDHVNKQTRGN